MLFDVDFDNCWYCTLLFYYVMIPVVEVLICVYCIAALLQQNCVFYNYFNLYNTKFEAKSAF